MMRPFETPLVEVAFEVQFRREDLVEFRARTFYAEIRSEFPQVESLPLFMVAPQQGPNAPPIPPTAAYRFFDSGRTRIVQIGPRLFGVNVLVWSGYQAFRDLVTSTLQRFADMTLGAIVDQTSISFINRIIASSVEELRAILTIPIPTRTGMVFPEFVSQFSSNTSLGSVLTQVMTMSPDNRTPHPYFNLNNIFRRRVEMPLHVPDIVLWMDAAHDSARRLMLESLTPQARESWDTTHASRH
ncbi:MAG: TIGR04255 family protein [Candidatus Eremiobacteraeota bacterium]|nr:TIGR04255 family protein [Candidatus Eremiobacteraeota bacterium]